jgi:hypothetical protein
LRVLAIITILTLLVGIETSTFAGETKTINVLKNVYTMIDTNGEDSNTTFIITTEGVIIIDTRPTPTEARKVLKEIRKLTNLPIKHFVFECRYCLHLLPPPHSPSPWLGSAPFVAQSHSQAVPAPSSHS